jgi:hypothetical protein
MKCAAPEKPQNAALAAENNQSLAALRAAREAQDAKWSYTAEASGHQSRYSAADQVAGSDQSTARVASAK